MSIPTNADNNKPQNTSKNPDKKLPYVAGSEPVSISTRRGQSKTAAFPIGDVPDTRLYIAATSAGLRVFKRPLKTRAKGAPEPEPVEVSPVPTDIQIIYDSDSDIRAADATRYVFSMDGYRASATFGEFLKGDVWGKFPVGVRYATRPDFADAFKLIKYLTGAPGFPVTYSEKSTGWDFNPDGGHSLILPDGTEISATGRTAESTRTFRHDMTQAQYYKTMNTGAGIDAQQAALEHVASASKRSIAAITLCAAFRSTLFDVYSTNCSLLLIGASGRGKTSLSNLARTITGDYSNFKNAEPTATFKDTSSSIEYSIARYGSLPVLIDDMIFPDDKYSSVRRSAVNLLESVIRPIRDGSPARGRMTRELGPRAGNKFRCLPILTGEKLPQPEDSLLASTILIEFQEDDTDGLWLRSESRKHTGGLVSFGHNAISLVAKWWDTDGDAFPAYIEERTNDWFNTIHENIAYTIGEKLPETTIRIMENASQIIVAAEIIDKIASEFGFQSAISAESILGDMLDHVRNEMQYLKEGRAGALDGSPFLTWLGTVIRRGLNGGSLYIQAQGGGIPKALNSPPTAKDDSEHMKLEPPDTTVIQWPHSPPTAKDDSEQMKLEPPDPTVIQWPLEHLGYRDTGNVENRWQPRGNTMIGYWLPRPKKLAFYPDDLFTHLREAAWKDQRNDFPRDTEELYKLLEDGGLVHKGTDGQRTTQVQAGGKNQRLLLLSPHDIRPEDSDDLQESQATQERES